MNSQLKSLLYLAQMKKEFENSKYVCGNVKVQNLQKIVDDLKTENRQAVSENTLLDPVWVNWIAEELERTNQKLAQVLVEIEIQKKVLGLTTGRAEMLKMMVNENPKTD